MRSELHSLCYHAHLFNAGVPLRKHSGDALVRRGLAVRVSPLTGYPRYEATDAGIDTATKL